VVLALDVAWALTGVEMAGIVCKASGMRRWTMNKTDIRTQSADREERSSK